MAYSTGASVTGISDRTQETSAVMSMVQTRITAQLPTTPKKSIVPAIAINRLRRERISRFVRAAFLKENSAAPEGEMGGVAQFFRILDAVAMVRGSVVTEAGECDVTTYSCCIDAESGVYYYKTYANSALAAVRLFAEDLEADRARFWPLRETMAVQYEN